MNDEGKKLHVVMLPWLAFGHMVPFLDLSMALAKRGVHVSFLSTPANISRLPKIPPDLSEFLQLVALPLPPHPLLPASAEATVDIPADQIEHLKTACDALLPTVRAFVSAAKPHWILADFFYHWAADLGIPVIIYQVLCATTSLFFLLAAAHHHHMTVPQAGVAYLDHEAAAMRHVFHGLNASRVSDGDRFTRLLAAARAVAIRSCPDLEGDAIRTYSQKSGKPIVPVGILPPPPAAADRAPWAAAFGWLDSQRAKSVVFVGFGSETKLTREHIHEIAHGLEQSELPFLWALREPHEDVLPAGFADRTAAQGLVHMGWAPQRQLLAHRAIGACFFHAGWGSIIEAMQFAHVLVFLPFIIDQPLNARMMVHKGLGIEVHRAKDGSFARDDVATALKRALASPHLRARTERATKEVFANYKLQEEYAESFIQFLNK